MSYILLLLLFGIRSQNGLQCLFIQTTSTLCYTERNHKEENMGHLLNLDIS